LEKIGYAQINYSLILLTINQRKNKKKRKRNRKRNKKKNKKNKKLPKSKNLRRSKNQRRKKIKRKRNNLMIKDNQKLNYKRKRRTLLTPYPNHLSILMTGNVNFVTLKTNQKHLNNYGLNLITMDGHFGKFIILNMKDKVLLDILQITLKMVI